jgi:hypothetical protein
MQELYHWVTFLAPAILFLISSSFVVLWIPPYYILFLFYGLKYLNISLGDVKLPSKVTMLIHRLMSSTWEFSFLPILSSTLYYLLNNSSSSACLHVTMCWISLYTSYSGLKRKWNRVHTCNLSSPGLKNEWSWVPVAHTCNLSYSGGREQEDRGSGQDWTNSSGK